MPIDPSIPLGFRPPPIAPLEIQSPLDRYTKMISLKNLMTEQQAGELGLQAKQFAFGEAKQQALEDLNLRDLYTRKPNPTEADLVTTVGPTRAAAIIKARSEQATNFYKQEKERYDVLGRAAGSATDLPSAISGVKQAMTSRAFSADPTENDRIGNAMLDHLNTVGFEPEDFKTYQRQAMEASKAHDALIADAEEKRKAAESPAKLEKTVAEADKAKIDALVATRQNDAAILGAAMRQSPQVFQATLGQLPEARRQPFLGAKTADDVLTIGTTAHEQILAKQAARTAAEAERHNLTAESTAKLQAAISAGKLAETRMVNGLKYSAGTQEYWADQLLANPDSVKEMPPELRTSVGKMFKEKTGLPLPTPLGATTQTQETAARNALDAIAFIRKGMQNPEIRAQSGPLMGRLGNAEQTLGTAVGLSPEAAALGQEMRTRMRYLFMLEGKAVLGGRMPQQLMKQLEEVTAKPSMDPNLLQGALNGASGAAVSVLDGADKQRFGGKNRTRAARGLPSEYEHRAQGPNGHIIGSHDGKTWYDELTGQEVKK